MRAEKTTHDLAGRRVIMNGAWQHTAEILCGTSEAFGFEIAQDKAGSFGHVAAAEDLYFQGLTRTTTLEKLVDELFHREIAETRRLKIAAPIVAAAVGKHEMIHPADAGPDIADASGNAGAENRHQDFVG